jgi:hypothetical protein
VTDSARNGNGHGVPPKGYRFGPGKPGNRNGRPKGSKNTRTIVRELAAERHLVKEDGQPVSYTTAELLIITLQRKAMQGDVRASKLLDRYRAIYQLEPEEKPQGVLLVPEPLTIEEWERSVKANDAWRACMDRTEWARPSED